MFDALRDIAPLDLVARWLHLGSVIVMVGGSVFMRFLLMPAANALPDSEHQALRERIIGRWRKVVHTSIGLLLLTGIYTLVSRIKLVGPAWHALFGIKFLLALVVFFIASALVGRSPALAPMRENRAKWLSIAITLATLIVLISGVLRYIPLKSVLVQPPV
jgi:hypothetical protein